MFNSIKSVLGVIGLTTALVSGSAYAFPLFPLTGFEDDNIEKLLVDIDTDGNLDVGDVLHANITFTQVFNIGGPESFALGAPGEEITGISEIEVDTKVATGTPGEFNYTFKPYAPFEATFGAGAMVVLWTEDPGDLDVGACTDMTDCDTKSSGGSLLLIAGFAGDPEEFWNAEDALETIATVAVLPASTSAGEFNFHLSSLFNGFGQEIMPQPAICAVLGVPCPGDGLIDVIGSGDLLGGQGLVPAGYFGRSDTDFQVKFVPEPTTVALLGIGLAGLGLRVRKQKA